MKNEVFGIKGLIKKIGVKTIALLSIILISSSVNSQPAITFPNCIQQSPNAYLCNINPSSPFVYFNIYNTEIPFNLTIQYNGIPVAIYQAGTYIASGSSFTANTSIPVGTTPFEMSVTSSGSSTISFLFVGFSNTTNSTITYNYTYSLSISLQSTTTTSSQSTTPTTSTTTSTTTPPTTTIPPQTNYTGSPVTPIYSTIYLTLYPNQTYEYPIGLVDTSPYNVTILSVIVQGLPPENANIQGSFGTLQPGQVASGTLHINTAGMQPGQYTFNILYSVQANNQVYNAQTTVTLTIISKLSQQINQTTQPTITDQMLPLYVNYSIVGNYLFIGGAYTIYNGEQIYIPGVNIMVIGPGGQALTYLYPIQVYPGQTYCIYGYKEGFVPFFTCQQIPSRPLCYILSPQGQQYNGQTYYQDGTQVTIKSIYDCQTLQPVYGVVIYYNNQPVNQQTFTIQEGANNIAISAPGYTLTNITLYGYTPVQVNNLPTTPGQYNITTIGTFASQAQLQLYTYINGTKTILATGTGYLFYNFTNGTYYLVLDAPLQNETTYTLTISPPIIPTQVSSFNIGEFILSNIWYFIIAFLIFTLISIILYKKSHKDVSELAKQIVEESKKL